MGSKLATMCSLWWQVFKSKNREFRMEPITADNCMFRIREGQSILIVAIVVDNVIMVGNNEVLLQRWFTSMNEFFTVSDNSNLKNYLRVRYHREGGEVRVTQEGHLLRVLNQY